MAVSSESKYLVEKVNCYGDHQLVNLIVETKYEGKHELCVEELLFPEKDIDKLIDALKKMKEKNE